VDPAAAEEFLRLYHAEAPDAGPVQPRLDAVLAQIDRHGTYAHTAAELTFGARVAWRNSNRCIGRLYWRSLRVRDRRHVTAAEEVAAEAVLHLREATNGGRVRPTVTVFAASTPEREGPLIWNDQLIRYAGYRRRDGTVVGDPRQADFTEATMALGRPGGRRTQFDVLPLVVQAPGAPPRLFEVPGDAVLEVPLRHPVTGGSKGSACAGTRSPPSRTCAWRSGASATRRRRSTAGTWAPRSAPATSPTSTATTSCRRSRGCSGSTWSWIVPPISGSATAVFHRYYDADLRPNYVRHRQARAPAASAPGE
jgi:nitric oxide synthase oxygenase domain/subunit